MGHRVKGTIFFLKFEDPEMQDIQVKAKKPGMGGKLDMIAFQDLSQMDARSLKESDRNRMREMFEFFGRYLVSWNLEEEESGDPIPCTVDGLMSLDDDYVLAIISAWVEAVGGVPDSLKERSSAGPLSGVESIPMEILSGSQPNSSGQS